MQLHDLAHGLHEAKAQREQDERIAALADAARSAGALGERKPIDKIRSTWRVESHPLGRFAFRNAHDGVLRCIIAEEPLGWHLSISHVGHRGEMRRYPRWDEIAHARDEFLPADVGFVMHLPAASEYVALHDTTFHLHEFPERAS